MICENGKLVIKESQGICEYYVNTKNGLQFLATH